MQMGATAIYTVGSARRLALSGEASGGFSPFHAFLAAAAGAWLLASLPVFHTVWPTWIDDPLRSIGIFFPVLSLVLVARVWRNLGWERSGSWWGLVPLLLMLAAVVVRETHYVTLVVRDVSINLVSGGPIVALGMMSGILMIGGFRVLRASLFPLALLLLLNPVPTSFNVLLDLPLQHASSDIARRFALLIGEHPDGEQLRLMFTPDFGMFIAPGCNGIRGAVTMGYVALIASFWRGLAVRLQLLAGLCGVALGYLFNFLRLCFLVVYYKVGRFVPAIQPHGALIDYLIGGSLFLLASIGFGLFLFRSNARVAERDSLPSHSLRRAPVWSAATFLIVSMALGASNLYAIGRDAWAASHLDAQAGAVLELPTSIGAYRLVAQWRQGDEYLWGRYSNGNEADDVSLGLWLEQIYHDALLCHLTRAEKTSVGEPIVHTNDGIRVAYRTFAYDDGLNIVYAASRLCAECNDFSNPERWFGPIQSIRRPADRYFKNASTTGVLILHEVNTAGNSTLAGYAPLRGFIHSLHEDTFNQVLKK
jgi:exosortase J